MAEEPVEKTGMDVGDLVPVFGMCCSISSLYLEWPQCIGCSGKGVCICYEGDGMMCKIPGDDEEEKTICIFSRTNVRCVKPSTCCKSTSQSWCIDSRCALPADEEVPCIFTFLPGCICMAFSVANFGCCQAIKDLKGFTPPTSA